MWNVYVLLCRDGSLYTGITNNLEKRFAQHVAGRGGRYTRAHRPIMIVYEENKGSRGEALKREAEIKRWRREKKIIELGLDLR